MYIMTWLILLKLWIEINGAENISDTHPKIPHLDSTDLSDKGTYILRN